MKGTAGGRARRSGAVGPLAVMVLAVAMALVVAMPAAARPHHRIRHARATAGSVPYPRPWGTGVYGESLPFVEGTCVDPFDPDPIGGPDAVGEGGPGGYGPQCRAQAGVIPGTTVR